MNNADKPFTHNNHRELAEKMLIGTKDLSPITVKIIGETIQNVDTNLSNIKFTLALFNILGFSYFTGNFANRSRFVSLVCQFEAFIHIIITKLRELGHNLTANTLLINID